MNYFRINLNKLEDADQIVRRQRMEALSYVVIAALFGAVFIWIASYYFRLQSKAEHFSTTTRTLKEQIEKLENSDRYISERDVQELSDLTRDRIFWTEKLEALAKTTGTTVALTSISFTNNKLYIEGIARVEKETNKFNSISVFIDALKAQDAFISDFPKIEFQFSERTTYQDMDIMNFEVLCYQE